MVELYVSAWHINEGHPIEKIKRNRPLVLKEGVLKIPDFIVSLPDSSRLVIECKHLRLGEKADRTLRIKEQIETANVQVESFANYDTLASSYYGAVVIDVTNHIGIQQILDDGLPLNVLEPLIEAAQAAVQGENNRSLGAVVLVWDDYLTLGASSDPSYIGYRRNCGRILHECPTVPIPDSTPIFQGNTLEFFDFSAKHG